MRRYTKSVALYETSSTKIPDEGAQVKVYLSTIPQFTTLATLFSDDDGTVSLAQPFLTNTLAQQNPGQFTFVVADGIYDIVVNENLGLTNQSVIPSQTIKDKDAYNLTKAEMIAANYLRVGDVVIVSDRDSSRFDIITGGTGNVYNVIQLAGTSFQASLIIGGSINFIEWGASGVDSSGAINSALAFSSAEGIPVVQCGGSFTCTSDINIPSNAVMVGISLPKIIFTSSVVEIKGVSTTIDGFDISCSGTVGNKGLIYSNGIEVSGTKIVNNKFSTAIDINGVKLIVDGVSTVSNNITIKDNSFNNVGRMGVELQNHGDTTLRFRDINITGNEFINTGIFGSFGQGVSASGVGERISVKNNIFDNNATAAMENVGFIDSEWSSNTLKNQPSASFSFSGSTPITGNIIQNNTGDDTNLSARVFLNVFEDSVFRNNTIHGTTAELQGDNNRVYDNNLTTEATVCFQVGGVSEGNVIRNNVFDSSGSASNFSVLRYFGSSCTNNADHQNVLLIGVGGVYRDEAGSASGNTLGQYFIENGVIIDAVLDNKLAEFELKGTTYPNWLDLGTQVQNNSTVKVNYQSGNQSFSLRIPDTEPRLPTVSMSFKWASRNGEIPRGGLIMSSFGSNSVIDQDPALSELGVGTSTSITRTNAGGFITWEFNLDITAGAGFSGVMEFTTNTPQNFGNMELSTI